jgi:hypothetical protein
LGYCPAIWLLIRGSDESRVLDLCRRTARLFKLSSHLHEKLYRLALTSGWSATRKLCGGCENIPIHKIRNRSGVSITKDKLWSYIQSLGWFSAFLTSSMNLLSSFSVENKGTNVCNETIPPETFVLTTGRTSGRQSRER